MTNNHIVMHQDRASFVLNQLLYHHKSTAWLKHVADLHCSYQISYIRCITPTLVIPNFILFFLSDGRCCSSLAYCILYLSTLQCNYQCFYQYSFSLLPVKEKRRGRKTFNFTGWFEVAKIKNQKSSNLFFFFFASTGSVGGPNPKLKNFGYMYRTLAMYSKSP